MTKRFKKLFSSVAITLCATIGLSFPTEVFASNLPKDDTVYSSFDDVHGESEIIGNIVSEMVEERTEYSKKFLLDDGTKMIAEYEQPIHYKDSNDNWVEYDNSLVPEKGPSTSDEANDSNYSNKSSDIDVNFSNKAKSNNMITVNANGYKISWGYDNTNKSKIKLVEDNAQLTGNERYTTLNNLNSEARYEDVYKNIDLQYLVTSTGVKENIILKSSDVQNEFNITYKIGKLTAKQIDDYTITLYDKSDKEIYSIIAPYMTDADGNTSSQLKLELTGQTGSNLSVKLTADFWFIHSIGRSFPVAIDPEITVKQSSSMTLLNGNGNNYYTCGPFTNSQSSYVIAIMNSLPELNDGEKIISAKFNFEATNGTSVFENENDSAIIVNAHKLTSIDTINTTVSYDSTILDYDSLTYNDNRYIAFDLTQLMNEWYNNGDNVDGFSFESYDTISSNTMNFQYAKKDSTTPSLTVVFKDFTGIESNLSYHTFSVGENAQASVSDYLGNLVIRQSIYEGTGSRMPASITATYNSINHNKVFGNGSPSGYGWQFSFNQYVREITDANLIKAGYNYIYTDSDGTDHYLKKSDSDDEWYDEDGLGITLTVDDNGTYIDNGSVIQTYELAENGGKLLSEKDEYNNTITYTYNSLGNLTKITDGSGRECNINYAYYSGNSEPRVKNIELPDGNKIEFAYYSNQLLACVKFPGEKLSWFYYTQYTSDGLLNKVEQRDSSGSEEVRGQKYSYTYNSNNQVTNIKEYGSDNTEGNYLNIQYNNDNTTTFTDRQGRTVTYTFDNSGNQISVLNANGYLESSGGSGLSVSSGAETFTKNYITESTEQSEIKSSGYYYKSNGDRNGVVSKNGVCTIDSSDVTEENGQVQYLGTTSIKVNNPVSSTNDAFFTGAAHQFNGTDFNGKDVTFSAYVKTKDIAQIYSDGAIGAILKIKCLNSSGTVVKELNSIGITGTEEWQRLSITATVPATTSKIRVYCLIRYASGTAWFDCLQFEEGNTASDFNALQNGDFETNDIWKTNENQSISAQNGTVTLGGIAGVYENATTATEATTVAAEENQPATYYETVTETIPNDSITTYDDYGNEIKTEQGFVNRTVKKTYEVNSATEPEDDDSSVGAAPPADNSLGNKYIYQNVTVDRAGVMFNIAGEAKADSVPLSNENRTYGIALNIYYNNNTVPETHYQEFNAATTHKQTVSMSVTPDNPNEEIDYVSFAFVYGNNKNTMTAYNAMLNIASTNYTDDDSSSDGTADNSNTNSSGSSTGSNTETDDYCINYEVLSESVDKSQTYMQTSKTYDSTGNYIASETDEVGNTTSYTYDVLGNKTSTTDGNNNVVNYTYDSDGNLASVSSNGASNTYSYNSVNNISAITHNGFSYTFNYDVFQKLVSTYIGTVAISTNTYDSNNGNLIETVFANGDYIQYTYDDYDNITEITGETGTIAEFVYNKKGLVAKVIDYSSGRTTYYYYDFSGTLTGEYRQTDEGGLSYYLSYDSDGNKVEKTDIEGHTKTIITGTDEDGNSFVDNNGMIVSGVSDDFGRTTNIITSCGEGNGAYITQYEYSRGRATNSTTNLVSTLTQRYGADTLVSYQYKYDRNGNVREITQDDKKIAMYDYDNLNQLKSASDGNAGLYTSYNYDKAGNITSVREYSLLDGSLAPNKLLSEKIYTYDDTNWKDKLTSYNGTTITYDQMGNPLSYRNGMTMTWQNGRQLASLQTGSNVVNYKYDSNGLRTQKNNGSKITSYYYDSNNNLIAMNMEGYVLYFYYDANGNVTSFSHNDKIYYYVKNLQGDVVKIINRLGETVVTYIYDAWGNILNQDDLPKYAISNLNPFRYRGYVYDYETGLYYLQSRYYDPVTGRFLNADDTQYIKGNALSMNLFTYCVNNPISYVDYNGKIAIAITTTTIIIGALTLTAATAIYAYNHSMAFQFYCRALSNKEPGKLFDFSDNLMYIHRILESNAIRNKITLECDRLYHSTGAMTGQKSTLKFYNNDSPDLYLSLGECELSLSIYVMGNVGHSHLIKWKVCMKLADKYNFEDWSETKKDALTIFLNNRFGYDLQEKGVLTYYKWQIYYKFYTYFQCNHPYLSITII